MRRFLSIVCISFIHLCLIAACGGGSSSAPAPPIQPPGISSVSPPDKANMVAVNSKATATFDKDMDAATFTDSTFTLSIKGGAVVGGTVSYDNGSKTATFTPSANLGYSTTYTAQLTTGVKDSKGTPVSAIYSWEFTTVPRTVQFGTVLEDSPAGVAVDSSGNLYVAGSTRGSFDIANQGDYDVFLAKYDKLGLPVWIRQFGTPKADMAAGVALDGSGNIYVTGIWPILQEDLDEDAQDQVAGSYDAFLAKYDQAGNRIWTRQFGAAGSNSATAIAVNGSDIWVAGYTSGTLPGSNVVSYGGYDAFLARFDLSGAMRFATQIGSAGNDYAAGLAIDAAGDLYLVGETTGQLAGATQSSSNDLFLAKLKSDGTPIWAKQAGAAGGPTRGAAVGVDDKIGVVYIAGSTSGSLATGESGALFLSAYKIDGTAVTGWTKQFGSTAGSDVLTAMTLDSGGNIYLTGFTSGVFSGWVNAGSDDVFLARYRADGVRSYIYQFGTPFQDRGYAISQDKVTSSIYLVGSTKGALDGNTNKDKNNTSTDVFVTVHPPDSGSRL